MTFLNYCAIAGGNFGDDINLHLWPRLFPNFSDLSGRVRFYGVGTLLDGPQDPEVVKVVLGSGVGEARGAVPGKNWDFRWVRGPMTAAGFGLDAHSGLGDAAILWPGLIPDHDATGPVGLIPHYATWASFDWDRVAQDAGMVAINPCQSPQAVVARMRGCSRILTESLHGAICADAMGIPWAACVLAHRFNEFKWRDWLATIDRAYEPIVMDRPLVRTLSPVKAVANKVAKVIHYKRYTRLPALRPVHVSTMNDARAVANALRQSARCSRMFAHSPQPRIERQRRAMQTLCSRFADDYQLQFNPA